MAQGCEKKVIQDTPEAALEGYVRQGFAVKDPKDKDALLKFLDGEAKEALSGMDLAEFEAAFLKPKRTLMEIKTKDRREESHGGVSLIYEISFKSGEGTDETEHFNRKVAFLKQEANEWKIVSTKNIKTFVEIKDGTTIEGKP
jgi:hypothetical protein